MCFFTALRWGPKPQAVSALASAYSPLGKLRSVAELKAQPYCRYTAGCKFRGSTASGNVSAAPRGLRRSESLDSTLRAELPAAARAPGHQAEWQTLQKDRHGAVGKRFETSQTLMVATNADTNA